VELIKAVKEEVPFPGFRAQISPTEEFRIRTLARGEQAFYQQNERALLLEISARSNIIFRKSIRWWDTGEAVTDEERDLIVKRLVDYLTSPRDPPVTISDE
jgi:hypothetical protein